MRLNKRSLDLLAGVDPRLADLIDVSAQKVDYNVIVTEGYRTKERQAELVKMGKSQTQNSYHLRGKAVDVMVNDGWKFEDYRNFADVVKATAKERNVKITWGGDWKTLKDGPHFQIEE